MLDNQSVYDTGSMGSMGSLCHFNGVEGTINGTAENIESYYSQNVQNNSKN